MRNEGRQTAKRDVAVPTVFDHGLDTPQQGPGIGRVQVGTDRHVPAGVGLSGGRMPVNGDG